MKKLSDRSDHCKEAVKKKVIKGIEKTTKKEKEDKHSHLDDEAAEVERAADEREKRKAEKKKAKKDESEKKKKKEDPEGDGKSSGSGKEKKSAALSGTTATTTLLCPRYPPQFQVTRSFPSHGTSGGASRGETELCKAGSMATALISRTARRTPRSHSPKGRGYERASPSQGKRGLGHHHDAAAGIVNDVISGCVYEFKPNDDEGPRRKSH